jgi:hypothetical protein
LLGSDGGGPSREAEASGGGSVPTPTSVGTGVPFVDVDALAGPVLLGAETLVEDRPHRLFAYCVQPSFILTLGLYDYRRLLAIAPSVSHALAALAFQSQPHLLLACVPCLAVALADHEFAAGSGEEDPLAGLPGMATPPSAAAAGGGGALKPRPTHMDSEQGEWARAAPTRARTCGRTRGRAPARAGPLTLLRLC